MIHMLRKTLAAATLALAFAAPQAQATVFTVDGNQYDITVQKITYAGNEALFQSQVWWGNKTLAHDLAAAVGASFGLPNPGHYWDFGPFFGYQQVGTDINLVNYENTQVQDHWSLPTASNTYAFATQIGGVGGTNIPEPTSLALLAIGASGMIASRRRKAA